MPGKHPNISILERYGFLNSRINIQLFCNYYVRGEAREEIRSSSATNIHYSYGDIDSLPTRIPRNIL
jgi:hypothetical protein